MLANSASLKELTDNKKTGRDGNTIVDLGAESSNQEILNDSELSAMRNEPDVR
jgi:hypothetical protein